MKCIISNSPEKTLEIAKKFASKLKGHETLAFFGEMGAGKTTFTRGLVSFFGLENDVSSPTFSILNEYEKNGQKIFHFDMYRIKTYEDLESTNFFEILDSGISIIEWSENILDFLPKNAIKITFNKINDKRREICFENFSN